MNEYELKGLSNGIQKAINEAEQNAARRRSANAKEAEHQQAQKEAAASQRAESVILTLPSRIKVAADAGFDRAVVMSLEPNNDLTPRAQCCTPNEITFDDLAGAALQVYRAIVELNARADFTRKLTPELDISSWRLLVRF